ncbi:PREDICTED: tubulin monoglycylase TTLL3-like, partial [Acanthisitta chloris]|uniref:tubulin monoglycylase TTLL3-like n=1 Tax=Acanthisitta chloris TaxID=57068 RepID=UPI0004F0D76E
SFPCPCLPHGAVDVGPAGSDGAVLTGQVAATTTGHCSGRRPLIDPEQLNQARLRVKKAIEEKKIFAVQGPYPIIRRLLRSWGWVERKLPSMDRQLKQQPGDHKEQQLEEEEPSDDGDEEGEEGEAVLNLHVEAQPSLRNEEEQEDEDEEQCNEDPDGIHDLMSYLVRNQLPNFIWTTNLGAVDHELLQQVQVVNHYSRVQAFATKKGLCLSLQDLHWFSQDASTFFPRCYLLGSTEEHKAFIEDFRLTAARSLLRLALEMAGDKPVGKKQPPKSNKEPARPGSPLSPSLVEDALKVCEQHLGILGHQDIDRNTPSPCSTCIDWDRFLQDYYRVAHEGARLALSREQQKQCRDLLQCLAEQLPQFGIEGDLNIWILKPGAQSQGRGKAEGSRGHTLAPQCQGFPLSLYSPGIVCVTRLEEVLQQAEGCMTSLGRVGQWVVQKYVERPLTIFGTKFDIRQWFVVTDGKPLTVWFYQDCDLRFCSRPFSQRRQSRFPCPSARHLCNVSVQMLYKTSPHQDPRVPSDRIWSNKQFQAHLAQLGQADAWNQVIVPGMKTAILDNNQPTMRPCSRVTRRLCANVQRDTLCLVLNHRDDSTCSIGAFELMYKETAMPIHLPMGTKLMLTGCSLKKPEEHRSRDKPRTTALRVYQFPMSAGGRATQVPRRRAAQGKLPPLGRRKGRRLPSSGPPTPTQPPGCSARSCQIPAWS